MTNNEIDYNLGYGSFFVDIEGDATKQFYRGFFKVKCVLGPLEYIQSDALYRELLGKTNPQLASDYVSRICYALSQLKFRIVEAPDWWKKEGVIGGGHLDDNILSHILEKSTECELDYRDGIEKKYKEAREKVKKAVDSGEIKKPENSSE
jgi:hypothetical protein